MIIPCPHCQARLNLPEDGAGIEVRCPGCRHVFRATPEGGQRAVEEGPPKRLLDPRPATAMSYPLDDDPYVPRPSRRSFDDDLDLREPHGDKKVLEDNAREHTRLAGQVMLAAGFGTLGGGLINRGIDLFQSVDQGRGANDPEFLVFLIFGIVIRAVFFAPLLIIVFSAGRNLLRLDSSGMIKWGIAASFVMATALAMGVVIDLFRLMLGETSPLVVPQMAITALSCGVCLTAGVLAIRALAEQHVRQYYDIERERRYRYRY